MTTPCPPKVKLEKYFLEKGADQVLAGHIQDCPQCQALLSQLSEERESFLQKYPFERFEQSVEIRRKQSSILRKIASILRDGFSPLRAALVVASLAGLMVFALWNHQTGTNILTPRILTKGGVGLEFHVRQDGQSSRGKDKMKLPSPADLQFVYSSSQENYFMLIGVEENRMVTVYTTGIQKQIPIAIRWTPTSRYERFFGISSGTPLSPDEAKAALDQSLKEGKSVEDLTRLPLSYSQSSVILYRQ